MLTNLASAVARRLLRQAEWARSRLAEHAGKQVTIESPLGPMAMEIAVDGHIEPARSDKSPDVIISLTPFAVAQWFTDRQAAWREARVEGDVELAAAISHVVSNLHWDFEEDLSRFVGDVAAHRVGQGARRLSTWPGIAAESAARGVAEYLTEESHVLATPLQVEEFTKNVDDLRDSVERLDKRIDRLADLISGSLSH